MFCQVQFMARIVGLTIGLTRGSEMADRCKRIHGPLATSEDDMLLEAKLF
jgi:hypothetical protein